MSGGLLPLLTMAVHFCHRKLKSNYVKGDYAGSVIVELGCGSASKTGTILDELLSRDGPAAVRFAGVDCSAAALDMAQASLIKSCSGLRPQNIELICAEYNDGEMTFRFNLRSHSSK